MAHAQRRLRLSSQIAALTLFCGRRGLWLGPPSESPEGYLCPDVDLPLDELASNVSELRDLSRAPLFRVEQGDVVHWAHRSFSEYLAAQFVSGLPDDKVAELLIHPDSPHVVPQLAGVAAWMASQHPGVFQLIMQRDPHVLLAADLGLTEPEDRHGLVLALLDGFEAGRLHRDATLLQYYSKLTHPELAEQLRTTISDRSLNELSRSEAIRIAWKCEAIDLQSLLADIALDLEDNQRVRECALLALTRMGADGKVRARLLPLAHGETGADPEDELKGFALEALWEFPRQIEPEHMFALLTRPKREDFLGAYRSFFESTLAHDLDPSLLRAAFVWLHDRKPACEHGSPFESLADSILRCGLLHLTDALLPDFARAVRWRLENHSQHVFGSIRGDDTTQVVLSVDVRRKLIGALVRLYPASRVGIYYGWDRHNPPLIGQEDASWLLEQIEAEPVPEARMHLAKLIRVYYGAFDDRLHEAAFRIPELFEEFAFWLKEVAIDSPEAEQSRETQRQIANQEQENREFQTEHAARRVTFDPNRCEQCLARLEAGDMDGFWHLNLALMVDPNGKRPGWEVLPDLKGFPGWEALSPELQARTRVAARRYLLTYAPRVTDLFSNRSIAYRPEMAGYRALLLLQSDNPTDLLQIPSGIWAKWAPTIIGYQLASNTMGTPSPHQQLVATAYRSAPHAVIEAVARLVDEAEQHDEGEQYDFWKLDLCQDARMGLALFELARREPPRRPATLAHLLREALLRPGSHHADLQRFAEGSLLLAASCQRDSRQRALIAGSILLLQMPNASFSAVWAAITKDPGFGKALLEKVATQLGFADRHTATWAANLTEAQIGTLWQWLCVHYPRAEY